MVAKTKLGQFSKLTSQLKQPKVAIALGGALLMAFLLYSVRAAGPLVSFEAETATGTNVVIKNDSLASAGKYIEFTGSGPVTFPEPMWHADPEIDVASGNRTKFFRRQVTNDNFERLVIVDDPKGIYGKVYRANLTPEDINSDVNRAEFYQALLGDSSTRLKLANDSTPKGSTQDIWFGWRSLFGKDVAVSSGRSNDGNYMQLKGDSSCGGPTVGLTIKYGHLTLRSEQYLTEHRNIAWNGPQMADILDDKWHTFVLHVRFSKDASIGYIEFWLDGERQQMVNGQDRIYFPTVCQDDTYVYPKMGVYAMDYAIGAGPVHWFDSPRIGTSYDSVVPR